jgi:predicted RNA methylase
LLPATVETVNAALAALDSSDAALTAIEVTENVAGDQRALHLVLGAGQPLGSSELEGVIAATRVTGCTSRTEDGQFAGAGEPLVSDPLPVLTGGRATAGELRRSPESFFQGNRHLLAQLVLAVIDAVPAEGELLDLYAGVGLFSISLAGTGRQGITAVEGDRSSGIDLKRNAAPFGEAVRTVIGRVEDHLARRRAVSTIIVDPPRTGISKEAMDAIIRQRAERVVYVSCDPPTMARDARRLLDAGYRLTALQGFDLFPNTPHVEALGVFQR